MKQKKPLILTLAFAGLLATGSALAEQEHNHDHDKGMKHDDHAHGMHDQKQDGGMFLEKKEIDGYTVSFHVMPAKKGMEHGGSHNLMIKIEQNGKALTDVKINSKVVHPNGKAETKPLMKMGDWYMNGYDLGHDGKHQLMILFKTADGKKHNAGVYYP
ncbi:MAG TPA: hypothetical protein ENK38_02730 [Gammaproteobacteria bacterium]|nr:hypothetical protein [Gammaproteobacteria bacterium]